jgi:hypothetical protein
VLRLSDRDGEPDVFTLLLFGQSQHVYPLITWLQISCPAETMALATSRVC